jgi:hypothetical protein
LASPGANMLSSLCSLGFVGLGLSQLAPASADEAGRKPRERPQKAAFPFFHPSFGLRRRRPLRYDLDDPTGRRVNQHRLVVDDGIFVVGHAIFRGNRIERHARRRQHVADHDTRMARPHVGRNVLLHDIVVESRRLGARKAANDSGRCGERRRDGRPNRSTSRGAGIDGIVARVLRIGRRRQAREQSCEYQGFGHFCLQNRAPA